MEEEFEKVAEIPVAEDEGKNTKGSGMDVDEEEEVEGKPSDASTDSDEEGEERGGLFSLAKHHIELFL